MREREGDWEKCGGAEKRDDRYVHVCICKDVGRVFSNSGSSYMVIYYYYYYSDWVQEICLSMLLCCSLALLLVETRWTLRRWSRSIYPLPAAATKIPSAIEKRWCHKHSRFFSFSILSLPLHSFCVSPFFTSHRLLSYTTTSLLFKSHFGINM